MNDEIMRLVIIGLIAYALGNINPSIIIGKIYGVDIRKEGSGNAGTTNTIRVIGLTAGLICLAVDILKAFAAVTIGYNMGDVNGSMVAFACVVLGHCFPVLWKFKGGKGGERGSGCIRCCSGSQLAKRYRSILRSCDNASDHTEDVCRIHFGCTCLSGTYLVLRTGLPVFCNRCGSLSSDNAYIQYHKAFEGSGKSSFLRTQDSGGQRKASRA